MIKLAMVGIGGYGGHICKILRGFSAEGRCRLVAAADSRLAELGGRTEALASEGVELFDDAIEMFARLRGRCDAVSICAGIPYHLPLAQAAARAGYHIHLEKPPASTVQDTEAIMEAVQQAGVMCMLGFHNVHGETMRFIKDVLVSGRLGKIKHLVTIGRLPRKRSYYTRNGWAGKLRLGRTWILDGPATNAMSHEIHGMVFLAGGAVDQYARPVSVRAELYSAWPIEGHDTAGLEIRTSEGPTAWLIGSHCTAEKEETTITIEAENGRALWEHQKATIEYADGSSEERRTDLSAREQMLLDFIEAVENGDASKLMATLPDGRTAMTVVNGAHDSSGTIHRIPSRYCRRVDDSSDQALTIVDGLDDYIRAAAGSRRLFSDLESPPPWAVGTARIDISRYDAFPQQFRCE